MAVFCMPFTFGDVVFRSWIFSDPMCPIVIFMQTLSVSASVFINVAIGIDRLLVVLYPLKCKRSKSRTKLVLLFIWLMSLILACMVAPVGKVKLDGERYQCQEVWPSSRHNQIFTILIFVLTYALPLLVLIISYSIVGIFLWRRTSPGNRDHVRDLMQLRAKVKVVKMLIVVVAMFGVCWMPLHILNVILNFRTETSSRADDTIAAIYISAHWLAMANSFANPIIYSFTNSIFREYGTSARIHCFVLLDDHRPSMAITNWLSEASSFPVPEEQAICLLPRIFVCIALCVVRMLMKDLRESFRYSNRTVQYPRDYRF
uniref:Neuropeptide Y receptor n=1 Tax=Magallana gigas TaxID=29159 RepID=K1Q7L6_MAGGI